MTSGVSGTERNVCTLKVSHYVMEVTMSIGSSWAVLFFYNVIILT